MSFYVVKLFSYYPPVRPRSKSTLWSTALSDAFCWADGRHGERENPLPRLPTPQPCSS